MDRNVHSSIKFIIESSTSNQPLKTYHRNFQKINWSICLTTQHITPSKNTLKNKLSRGSSSLTGKDIRTNENGYLKSLQKLKLFKTWIPKNSRYQLLTKISRAKTDNITFMTTFDTHLLNTRSAISKHWEFLKLTQNKKKHFKVNHALDTEDIVI